SPGTTGRGARDANLPAFGTLPTTPSLPTLFLRMEQRKGVGWLYFCVPCAPPWPKGREILQGRGTQRDAKPSGRDAKGRKLGQSLRPYQRPTGHQLTHWTA